MGIRRGRRTALASGILGVVLCAGAGRWFWEDLLEWTHEGVYSCEAEIWNRFVRSVLQLAVPELKAALDDESVAREKRVDVAHTLSWVIPSDPRLLGFLQEALRGPETSMHAIYALGSMGHWAKPAVPQILELALKEEIARSDVVLTLGRIGDERAVPVLERLAEEDVSLEEAAGEALKKIRGR